MFWSPLFILIMRSFLLLRSIRLYGCTAVYPFACWKTSGLLLVWGDMIRTAIHIHVQFFVWGYVFISPGRYLRVGLLVHTLNIFFFTFYFEIWTHRIAEIVQRFCIAISPCASCPVLTADRINIIKTNHYPNQETDICTIWLTKLQILLRYHQFLRVFFFCLFLVCACIWICSTTISIKTQNGSILAKALHHLSFLIMSNMRPREVE